MSDLPSDWIRGCKLTFIIGGPGLSVWWSPRGSLSWRVRLDWASELAEVAAAEPPGLQFSAPLPPGVAFEAEDGQTPSPLPSPVALPDCAIGSDGSQLIGRSPPVVGAPVCSQSNTAPPSRRLELPCVGRSA